MRWLSKGLFLSGSFSHVIGIGTFAFPEYAFLWFSEVDFEPYGILVYFKLAVKNLVPSLIIAWK
jgi:hypothetical protein